MISEQRYAELFDESCDQVARIERSIVNCYGCGVMLPYAKAIQEFGHFYCASCYETSWDEDEDEEDEPRSTCSCPYCFCMNDVSCPGEVCGDCNAHAHQG